MVCLFVLAIPLATAAEAVARTVTIQTFAFGPATLTINAGDTVTWQNADPTAHTATSNVPGQFDTAAIAPGAASRPIAFAQAGTFTYHCAIHPGMLGTIIVQAAATPIATPRQPTPPPTPPAATTAPPAPPTPAPTTAAPTGSPTASPSPASTPIPSATGTQIAIPTSLAIASPNAAPGGGRDIGNGPGTLLAAGGAAIAIALAGTALHLSRRR